MTSEKSQEDKVGQAPQEDDAHSSEQLLSPPDGDLAARLEEQYHELEDRISELRERLNHANDQAVHFIQQNPAVSLIGAVAVGYIIGRLAARRWLV